MPDTPSSHTTPPVTRENTELADRTRTLAALASIPNVEEPATDGQDPLSITRFLQELQYKPDPELRGTLTKLTNQSKLSDTPAGWKVISDSAMEMVTPASMDALFARDDEDVSMYPNLTEAEKAEAIALNKEQHMLRVVLASQVKRNMEHNQKLAKMEADSQKARAEAAKLQQECEEIMRSLHE